MGRRQKVMVGVFVGSNFSDATLLLGSDEDRLVQVVVGWINESELIESLKNCATGNVRLAESGKELPESLLARVAAHDAKVGNA